jgi:predicted anti-sigma-YlaC factor YlaD
MAESGSVVQMFRLLFDRATANATEKAAQESLAKGTDPKRAKENLTQVKSLMKDLEHGAIHLGEALLAAFAFHKILGFFEASIHAAAENEHSMHQLETAVTNAGGSFEKMEPQINANLNALYSHSRFTRVELRASLGSLIQLTGDVGKSMAVMSTVVEFATGRNLDLGTAATLVGRYLTGNTNALTRYIGKTAEGINVMDRLAKTFKNAAENEMKSYEGRLLSITKAKNDLLVAVGELIVGDTALGGTTTNVSDLIKAATGWVKAHHTELSQAIGRIIEFGAGLMHLAGTVLPYLGRAYQEAQVAIVALTALWEAAGEAAKLMADKVEGAFGDMISNLVVVANYFDIHTFDAVGNWGARIASEAKKGAEAAKQELKDIKDAAVQTAHDILNPPATQAIGHRGLGVGDTGPLPGAVPDPDKLEKEFEKLMAEHRAAAEMAQENIKLGIAVMDNMKVLADEEAFFGKIANDSTKTAKDRNAALREQYRIQQEILDQKFAEEQQAEFMAGTHNPYAPPTSQARIRATLGPGAHEGDSEQKLADIEDYGKVIGTLLDGIDNNATKVAENIYDVFYKNLNHVTLSFKGLAGAVAGIFKGTAKAILQELQEEAKGQAIHDAAAAIQQFAWGLARSAVGDAAGATLHYASAKTFALSALEWGGAALAEGALLGGVGGGGAGGGPGSLAAGTGTNTQDVNAQKGTINVYLDGVDPLNPRHQELVGEANRRFNETGGLKVVYHPGRHSA